MGLQVMGFLSDQPATHECRGEAELPQPPSPPRHLPLQPLEHKQLPKAVGCLMAAPRCLQRWLGGQRGCVPPQNPALEVPGEAGCGSARLFSLGRQRGDQPLGSAETAQDSWAGLVELAGEQHAARLLQQ